MGFNSVVPDAEVNGINAASLNHNECSAEWLLLLPVRCHCRAAAAVCSALLKEGSRFHFSNSESVYDFILLPFFCKTSLSPFANPKC